MVSAHHEGPTRSATSPAFTNGFLIRGAMLVHEIRLVPEMSVTFGARDTDGGEDVLGARHTVATRLVTLLRNVSPNSLLHTYMLYTRTASQWHASGLR